MTPSMIYIPGVSIAIVMQSGRYTADTSHRNFDRIVEAAKQQEWDKIPDLVDISKALTTYSEGKVQIVDGEILYEGMAIHNTLTERIIRMMNEGFIVDPMIEFFKNLMQNPSESAVNELYSFMEVGQLPITEDGHFLAYKKVSKDYTDIYSGRFDNSVGKICEMARHKVNPDRDQTCSDGLHFCSYAYLGSYGTTTSRGDHTMIVKINPRDVVSIPSDYNNTKGRCCRYEVIGEIEYEHDTEPPLQDSVYDTEHFNNTSGYGTLDLDDTDIDDYALACYHEGYKSGRNKDVVDLSGVHPLWIRGYRDGRAHKRKAFN